LPLRVAEAGTITHIRPAPSPATRKADAPADPAPVATFERNLEQLEQLVETMERGEMTLEDSLAAYEHGVGLYRHCQQALEQAELRVRLVSDPEHPERGETFPVMNADTSDA